jgi:hypothetical protein
VLTREFDKDHLSQLEDWQGNNIALACPICLKVFIVSGLIHKNGRACPNCGKSKASVSQDGTKASVQDNESDLPKVKLQPVEGPF